VQVDVSKPEQVEQLVKAAVDEYGRLDIMVNNAGIGITDPLPIWDLPVERWDRMQDINCKGVFLGIKYAAKQMISQEPHATGDKGWIINAASILGLTGQSAVNEYCAAKGAVVNMTRSAAMDCAPHRIHVNAFAPGYSETNMTVGVDASFPGTGQGGGFGEGGGVFGESGRSVGAWCYSTRGRRIWSRQVLMLRCCLFDILGL
jgi:NAD(P)-dependent dehydrogenase (short-subunit alcohol dehydrogenase family)